MTETRQFKVDEEMLDYIRDKLSHHFARELKRAGKNGKLI